MVEIWRQPTHKDLVGWRGPCRVVSINQTEHGLVEVEWQGRTMSCKLSDVRTSTLLVLLISEPSGTPWQVVVNFLKGFHSGHVTCAWVYTEHGWQLSKVATEQTQLLKSLLHTAHFELGLNQCVGARLGRQLCQLPGLFGIELGLLLWWPTKAIHDYRSWEHPGHQTIDIKHILKGANERDISWVQFLCAEQSHIRELRQSSMHLDPWWWNKPNGHDPGNKRDESDTDGGDELGPLPSEAHMHDPDDHMSLPSTVPGSPVRSAQHHINMSEDNASLPSTVRYLSPVPSSASKLSPMPSTVKYLPSATGTGQSLASLHEHLNKRPLSTTTSNPSKTKYQRADTAQEKRSLDTNSSNPRALKWNKTSDHTTAASSSQTPGASLPFMPHQSDPIDHAQVPVPDEGHESSAHESEPEDYADYNGFFVGTSTPIVKDLDELSSAEVKLHWDKVSAGIVKELSAFNDLKSFTPHPRSQCTNLMSARWLFKWKIIDQTRQVKARLTLRGFQDKAGASIATYASTATRWAQRVICSFAVLMQWTILTWDVSNAFLRGMSFEELAQLTGETLREVQFEVPEAYRHFFEALPVCKGINWSTHALRCLKAIYGLKDAPRAWRLKLHAVFLKLGAIQLAVDKCLYAWRENGLTVLVGSVHVDDVKASGTPSMLKWLRQMLEEVLGPLKQEEGTFEHLGIKHEQDPMTKEIRAHQTHYAQKLSPVDTKTLSMTDEQLALDSNFTSLYLTLLGALSWLCQTRLDICVYVQSLQRSASRPNIGCLIRLNRVTNWVRRKVFVLTYRRFNLSQVRLMAVSDAAFRREDLSGLSLRGHIILLTENHLGHPGGCMHPIEWSCRKQKRVVRSTYGAELHSVSDAIETALVIRSVYAQLMSTKLLNALELANCIVPPLQASIDCRSVFDSLASEETKRPSEESLIFTLLQLKELLRHKKLERMWWVTTGDMLADCMNKGVVSRQYLLKTIHSGTWSLLNDTVFHEETHAVSIT